MQPYPPLAMYLGFVSGPCSGAEKHLRTFLTLILSSGTSCLLNSTSFTRLKTLLLLKVQRRRDKLLHKTFPCTRMLAPHSIPRLRVLLQASNGPQLSREMFSMSLESICTHEPSCPASTCSKALNESGAFLACFEQAPLPALAHHIPV